MTYKEIEKLFGTPLKYVPKPAVSFKPTNVQIALGIVIIGFTFYGIYAAGRDLNKLKSRTGREQRKNV